MNDFGGRLRQARERRGISLRQIATSTKLSATALEALERNDISKLPGGIFSRAFIRSYAVEVGLHPEETVREFLERFNEEPPPSADTIDSGSPRLDRRFQDERRRAAGMLAFTGLIIIVIVIAGVLLWRARAKHTGMTTPGHVQSYAFTHEGVIPAAEHVR